MWAWRGCGTAGSVAEATESSRMRITHLAVRRTEAGLTGVRVPLTTVELMAAVVVVPSAAVVVRLTMTPFTTVMSALPVRTTY